MVRELKILQIGIDNWKHHYDIPENMDWYYFCPDSPLAIRKMMETDKISSFHAILIEDGRYLSDLLPFSKKLDPYTVFYPKDFQSSDSDVLDLLKKRCARAIDFSEPERLLKDLSTSLFGGGYGDKMKPSTIQVHHSFQGSVSYQGHEYVELEGDFGEEFSQLAYWSYNIAVTRSLPIELWLEYEKSSGVEFRFRVKKIFEGSIADITEDLVFEESDLASTILIEQTYNVYLALSIEVRGKGKLKIGNLHQRWSRKQFGKFVLGGNTLHDKQRDEINYFFHPGDFKPPLAIYFAGYRPAEGFEGYWMMKNLGCPFLLFSDPRIEGGAFYIGSEELESKVRKTIQYYLDYLGLTSSDLILSGLSMGTFPALYYGSFFEPYAVVVGKPLTNIGTVARRGRLDAPWIFNTGFDVLNHQTGGLTSGHVTELDQYFWKSFKRADFSNTTFGLSYMKDEDMDPQAYEELVEHLCNTGAKILSRGTSGRHNDDTGENVAWFLHFYHMVLKTGFGRGEV